ncbi:pentapeptide repeat-containing protein [Methanococcoides sp. FTZ1]|uniref:pentapeptide repeat-containing protein n=1 Tax=Methanococcoides sp. FTZ1 TaxID=3439061 RepID=UPI003F84FDBF
MDKNELYSIIKPLVVPFILLLYAFFTYCLIFVYPETKVAPLQGSMSSHELIEMENRIRATSAQIAGGFAILIGLLLTWWRISITERRVAVSEDNLEISKEGQITERFTRAIDQLGKPELEIRLGGIYALERISKESEKDYWPIMEILTSYVRINSAVPETIDKAEEAGIDIQAICTILVKRELNYVNGEPGILNLKRTNLKRVDLNNANLEYADLRDSNLEEANLEQADLKHADLRGSYLEQANLFEAHLGQSRLEKVRFWNAGLMAAHLEDANLYKADFKSAALSGADLRGANLIEATLIKANLMSAHLEKTNLEGADLRGADLLRTDFREAKLEGADLRGADLWEADLREANLEGAKLDAAKLRGANLEGAIGLTINQLSKAHTLYNSKFSIDVSRLKGTHPLLFEKPKD